MSSATSVDVNPMDMNTSSTNSSLARSKKLPPPPLRLPAPVTHPTEDKVNRSNQQTIEQRRISINHNSCSSSNDCAHNPIPFVNKFFQ